MKENISYDSLIIGSGPAGLTAAIYQIRAGLKTIVIAGGQPGGQLTITTVVENFPGFPTGVGGVKLMMDTQQQVKNLGGEIKNGVVKVIQKQDEGFIVKVDDGTEIKSKAIIVATGAKARWLDLAKEKELIGKGVSGCATCDGFFYRDKIVAVVGGGDTACEDTGFLAKMAAKVYLIHRRDTLRASAIEQKKVMENPKVEIIWNTEVKEIIGEKKVEKIKLVNNKSGEEKILNIDGLFVAIGRDPVTEFLRGVVELKETGHVVVGKNLLLPTMTTTDGIFAAGDCCDEIYRQAIVAAGDGCRAAKDVERWFNSR